jgi:hypothetical protein
VTLPVRISEEADAEVAEAARWYETHRSGLGIEFLDALDIAVARIAEAPRMGSLVPGSRIRRSAGDQCAASPTTLFTWSFRIGSRFSRLPTTGADPATG